MVHAATLIPELADIGKARAPERHASALSRIADLFLRDASRLNADQVELFDGVFSQIIPHAPGSARATLSERLAGIVNAPPAAVLKLAYDTDIRVAGPVLRASVSLDDQALVDLARTRGTPHLLALTARTKLAAPVTDVLVRRGDRDVVRAVAANAGAHLSDFGFAGLITRAGEDGMLALSVAQRDDLSPQHLKDLLGASADIVRRRVFSAAKPSRKSAIAQAMVEILPPGSVMSRRRDFAPAQRKVLSLLREQHLGEDALMRFATQHLYEESVATLAALSRVNLNVVDKLLCGDRPDPILLLGRSLDFGWPTVRALIALRAAQGRVSSPSEIEDARVNYQRLARHVAQRVLGFWQKRQTPG